jgi:hypothetical protein
MEDIKDDVLIFKAKDYESLLLYNPDRIIRCDEHTFTHCSKCTLPFSNDLLTNPDLFGKRFCSECILIAYPGKRFTFADKNHKTKLQLQLFRAFKEIEKISTAMGVFQNLVANN